MNGLPDVEIWSSMERINALNSSHAFVACRPDRPAANYTVDFSSAEALSYIPAVRTLFHVEGNIVVMPHAMVPLSAIEHPFIRLVDGRRTIREIAALVATDGASQPGAADIEDLAQGISESLASRFSGNGPNPGEAHQLSQGPSAAIKSLADNVAAADPRRDAFPEQRRRRFDLDCARLGGRPRRAVRPPSVTHGPNG
jgi:hypothetical protein